MARMAQCLRVQEEGSELLICMGQELEIIYKQEDKEVELVLALSVAREIAKLINSNLVQPERGKG